MGLLATYRLANQTMVRGSHGLQNREGILRLLTGVRSVSHPGTHHVCGHLLSNEVSVASRIHRYDEVR